MHKAFLLALTVLATCACTPGGPSEAEADKAAELHRLLACNDATIGGDTLRAAKRVDYEIDIEEPSFKALGRYYATRSGEMRIDVYMNDERVFSEGLDGAQAWELPQNATEPVVVGGDAAAALRHGIDQPGHLWTLADMPRNGQRLEHEGREAIDGVNYHVVHLTLKDGFELWYWLHPDTCHIERSRNFRAYHPSVDPERRWTETMFEGYEDFDGITKPRATRDVDFATGETIGRTRIRTFVAVGGS